MFPNHIVHELFTKQYYAKFPNFTGFKIAMRKNLLIMVFLHTDVLKALM